MYELRFMLLVRDLLWFLYVIVVVVIWLLFFNIVVSMFISKDFLDFIFLIMNRLIFLYWLGGLNVWIFFKRWFFVLKNKIVLMYKCVYINWKFIYNLSV